MTIPSLFALTSLELKRKQLPSLPTHLDAISISRVKKARRDHQRCPKCSRYWHKDDIKECLLFADECELEEVLDGDGAILTEGQPVDHQTLCLGCYNRWKVPLRCFMDDKDHACTGPLQVVDMSPFAPEADAWLSHLFWLCEKHQVGATAVIGEAYDAIETFGVKRSQPRRRGRIGPSA